MPLFTAWSIVLAPYPYIGVYTYICSTCQMNGDALRCILTLCRLLLAPPCREQMQVSIPLCKQQVLCRLIVALPAFWKSSDVPRVGQNVMVPKLALSRFWPVTCRKRQASPNQSHSQPMFHQLPLVFMPLMDSGMNGCLPGAAIVGV